MRVKFAFANSDAVVELVNRPIAGRSQIVGVPFTIGEKGTPLQLKLLPVAEVPVIDAAKANRTEIVVEFENGRVSS